MIARLRIYGVLTKEERLLRRKGDAAKNGSGVVCGVWLGDAESEGVPRLECSGGVDTLEIKWKRRRFGYRQRSEDQWK